VEEVYGIKRYIKEREEFRKYKESSNRV